MAYTAADLIQEALERLGVVGDGQAAEPEDAAKVRNALPGILADIRFRDIYYVPNESDIEPAAFQHLADIVANAVSGRFGLDQNETVIVASRGQAAEQKLRHIRSLPYSAAPARPCWF